MRAPKADALKRGDSVKSGVSKEKPKKVDLPFKTFSECLRYLFVKPPERMEDIQSSLKKSLSISENKTHKQIDELNVAIAERIKTQEEKLYAKDLEFTGDIQEIKKNTSREFEKLNVKLLQVDGEFKKEMAKAPNGSISEAIVDLGERLLDTDEFAKYQDTQFKDKIGDTRDKILETEEKILELIQANKDDFEKYKEVEKEKQKFFNKPGAAMGLPGMP